MTEDGRDETLAATSPPASSPGADRSSTRTDRAFIGWFWMAFGTGAQAALMVAVLATLSRLLTPNDFGLLSASLLVINFSLIFSQLGVGPAIVQRAELRDDHIMVGFTLAMLLSFACVGLICLLAPVIARFMHAPPLVRVLRALAWVLVLQALSVVSDSLLRRQMRFRALASFRVVSYALGYGVVGIGAALVGAGVWALVAAHATQTLTSTILVTRAQPHSLRLRWSASAARELASFGTGFSLARIGNYAAVYGDNLVTLSTLGVTALGLY